ncbi:cation diffusion facilitator family transporter [Aeromonas sobria]|uniref:Cation diffusion facilitator family transporter n=1 Tax=Aeromonas sobria TaxID=646 RepID=A0A1S2D7T3_AERSO|nr:MULTISPECIES: cation diffusion facilitator family transporter [Aeromonas]ATL92225.1 cation transporter [Aeromonas sp. CU5]MBS4685924.1 cation diffusion facilitator family transporter [Aeromonas sobria]MCX7128771.1 cation diffusion facilitator family transporter [Aeromonas sp.]OHY96935.1 cation diffusion facilitator family transporter [Aeromonas sobria]
MAHYRHVISTFITTEKQALTLSLFGSIGFAIFGIGYGLLVGSHAIMLDGLFSLFSMGMTGLGLITAYLVTRPSDARFQYGYAHFEPIANVINGVIILLLCLGALYSGITTLLAGGRDIDLGHALICAAISTFLCSLFYLVEARLAKQFNSELVRVDSEEWLVDTILSATLLVGFLVAMGLDTIGYGQYNRYIDPVLVSLLALCATLIPIKVLSRNLREVLKIAPKGDVPRQVEREIEALRQRHGIECYSHLAKSGRRFDLELNILIAPDQEWSVDRQDALRHELWSRLGDTLGDAWLSVCFTREKRWL